MFQRNKLVAFMLACGFLAALASMGGARAEAPALPAGDDTMAASPGPVAVIEKFHTHLLGIMKRSDELGQAGRTRELLPAMVEGMDVRAIGGKAIGRSAWRKLTEAERDAFIASFTRFMSSTYAARFRQFNGQEFVTTGTRQGARDSLIMVETKMVHPSREPTQIHYMMINREGAWKIADIFLDGAVSEVAMRRSEFSSILRDQDIAALVAAIDQKTSERMQED